MFRVLRERLGSKGELTYFIDCKTLGSGMIGLAEKPEDVARKYFRSFLNELGTQMMDTITHSENANNDSQENLLTIL
jgi:hypothetical protein